MGDEPKPVVNGQRCDNYQHMQWGGSPWPDSMQPDYIKVELWGHEKGPEFMEGVNRPPPADGTYILPFHNCMVYGGVIGGWDVELWFTKDDAGGEILTYAGVFPSHRYQWGFPYPLEEVMECITYAGWDPWYTNGHARVTFYLNGTPLPASWAAAALVGVPATKGYLAEQGHSGLDANHYRYCARHNKTNVKIITGAAE